MGGGVCVCVSGGAILCGGGSSVYGWWLECVWMVCGGAVACVCVDGGAIVYAGGFAWIWAVSREFVGGVVIVYGRW